MSEASGALRAAVVVAAALFVAMIGWAPSAAAHAALIASDPADGAVVTEAPAQVSATFNEEMQARFAAMTVIGPDGQRYDAGEPAVAAAVISVGVRPGGPAGTYTVNYRATSADGHVVSGTWSYRVAPTAPTATATPTTTVAEAPGPADDDGTGTPLWPFALAVTTVIAVGAIAAARRRS